MEIEVKGHSGCQIDVVDEDGKVIVYKSTVDPGYLERLALQAEKQIRASDVGFANIKVPKIYSVERLESRTVIKMQYVYSKNFMEYFDNAGFEQVDYLTDALEDFIDYEVRHCRMTEVGSDIFVIKFNGIKHKMSQYQDPDIKCLLERCFHVFDTMGNITVPVGVCHGDLTLSNLLFNGNNFYLIDFLDSFLESPLQDIVKIRQDTAFGWSRLMYTRPYDKIRFNLICSHLDRELDKRFREKYIWYGKYYDVLQLMNMLRILPYAKDEKVIVYLKEIIGGILNGLD